MGYQPAGTLTTQTATFPHLATVYYSRKALDQLLPIFRFRNMCEPDSIPLRSGKTVQWYRFGVLGANTTPASEGTIGTPVNNSTSTISATVAEYADFSSLSRLYQETTIDSGIENMAQQLGFRAGLSFDTIARTEFDSVNSSATDLGTLGATISVNDFRRVGALFGGANIRTGPRGMNEFAAAIHPYVKYDLCPTTPPAGSLTC